MVGPVNKVKTPPLVKSFWSSNPVANETAFEGVDTGNSKAEEQLNDTIKGTAKP
jgi:hypothetical protein